MSDGRRRGVLIAVLLTACTAPTGQAPSAPPPPLHLEAQVPGEVFPGGRIDVLGDAFLWGTAGETVVWFDGSLDDRPSLSTGHRSNSARRTCAWASRRRSGRRCPRSGAD